MLFPRISEVSFREWDGGACNFIPQGGGDHYEHHRCAGEWITIELMKRAATLLTAAMDYRVPRQNLAISLSRLPACPKSGFVIDRIRRTDGPERGSQRADV